MFRYLSKTVLFI